VQKFSFVNYMFEGAAPPTPGAKIGNATVRMRFAAAVCAAARGCMRLPVREHAHDTHALRRRCARRHVLSRARTRRLARTA
jgi:hypothetical protein